MLERQIDAFTKAITNVEIIDIGDLHDENLIQFGATVALQSATKKASSYSICSMNEVAYNVSYISEHIMKIYYRSTIAQSLLSKKVSDTVTINTKKYLIINISYENLAI